MRASRAGKSTCGETSRNRGGLSCHRWALLVVGVARRPLDLARSERQPGAGPSILADAIESTADGIVPTPHRHPARPLTPARAARLRRHGHRPRVQRARPPEPHRRRLASRRTACERGEIEPRRVLQPPGRPGDGLKRRAARRQRRRGASLAPGFAEFLRTLSRRARASPWSAPASARRSSRSGAARACRRSSSSPARSQPRRRRGTALACLDPRWATVPACGPGACKGGRAAPAAQGRRRRRRLRRRRLRPLHGARGRHGLRPRHAGASFVRARASRIIA